MTPSPGPFRTASWTRRRQPVSAEGLAWRIQAAILLVKASRGQFWRLDRRFDLCIQQHHGSIALAVAGCARAVGSRGQLQLALKDTGKNGINLMMV